MPSMTTYPLLSLRLVLLHIELVIKLAVVNDLYARKLVVSALAKESSGFLIIRLAYTVFFSWRVTDIKNEQY